MTSRNWKNRTLFHGDNLRFLRAMNSESVDLIATDPPYKKGRDLHATPDSLAAGGKFQDRWSWERDVHQSWIDQIRDDYPEVWEVIDATNAVYMKRTKRNLKRPRDEVGSDMGAFLCFMAVRLLEMHRVLAPTGSIYLHCDRSANHYLKAVLDAIFGCGYFINEIIWQYKTTGTSRRRFARNHDTLLLYSKTRNYVFNPLTERSYLIRRYGFSNIDLSVDDRGVYKRVGVQDVWDIPALRGNQPEKLRFPTQKPLALYERMIRASSNEGGVVLDPFAGCGTTCIAAERLGRQWVGIDIWKNAKSAVLHRLEAEGVANEQISGSSGGIFTDQIVFTKELPQRTDAGEEASPFLRGRERMREPEGSRMNRKEVYEILLERYGPRCQGCNRVFDDPRYLELDHNTPRADGGTNRISNRVLLCGPCHRLKSNRYTLLGLRRQNHKLGFMYKGRSLPIQEQT